MISSPILKNKSFQLRKTTLHFVTVMTQIAIIHQMIWKQCLSFSKIMIHIAEVGLQYQLQLTRYNWRFQLCHQIGQLWIHLQLKIQVQVVFILGNYSTKKNGYTQSLALLPLEISLSSRWIGPQTYIGRFVVLRRHVNDDFEQRWRMTRRMCNDQ